MQVSNLKSYLANINMTLIDFANIIEYDPKYLCRVVNGKCPCTIRMSKEIYRATSGIINLPYKSRKHSKKHKKREPEKKVI